MIFVFYNFKKFRSFPSWLSTLYTEELSKSFKFFVSGHILALTQNSSMLYQMLSLNSATDSQRACPPLSL